MKNLRLLLLFTVGFLLAGTQFVDAQEDKKVEQKEQIQIEEEKEKVEVKKAEVKEHSEEVKQKPASIKEEPEQEHLDGEGKKKKYKKDDGKKEDELE